MRVLTVSSPQERIHNMVGAVRSITEGRGSNFFLFSNWDNLAATNPLQAEWVSGKGQQVRITD